MKINDIINNYEITNKFKKEFKYFDNKYNKYRIAKHSMLTVKCQTCNTIKDIRETEVYTRGCKSLQCHPKFIDISGQIFGNLTVLHLVNTKTKTRPLKWLCKCNCGKEILVPLSQLRHGQIECKSCTSNRTGKTRILPNDKAKWNRILKQYRLGAKNRNLAFKIDFKTVKTMCLNNCIYCNAKPTVDKLGLKRNGIDRIDSSKGYLLENVVTCCEKCNRMKLDLKLEEFITHIKKLYTNVNNVQRLVERRTPK